ncbi:MAG TPA: D-glucuronyl C5-epimerase family protein [Solirubrobacteraceae bacterium]|nr:D-glucuronyl C5-epimerase family protein [Solirubrobacteraceae bacterium]
MPHRLDAPSARPRWPVVALAAAAATATAGGTALAGGDEAQPASAAPAVATVDQPSGAAGGSRRTEAWHRARAAAPPPILRSWRAPHVDAHGALGKVARRAEAHQLRDSTRVRDVLRRALLLRQIDRDTHDRHLTTWEGALEAAQKLSGRRAKELGVVIHGVQNLSDRRLLSASRMTPVFLMLRENTRLWRTAKLPASRDRRTVADGAVVLEHYAGKGWQLQPLASWGKLNALAARCLSASQARQDGERTCPQERKRLRERLDTLLDLAVPRGGRYPAWEYLFSYAGGSPPWVSGMAQATAAQALARAGSALDSGVYRNAARDVVGAFEHAPPFGVAVPGPDDGSHYALYAFQPGLRVLNAELQAVLALRDVSTLTGDTTARGLYLRGDRALRATLARYDTGAWSRYSIDGREATAGYHRLQRRLLGRMCERTDRDAYCAPHQRFLRYESEAPDIDLKVPERTRTGREVTTRFTLSKTSRVALRVADNRDKTNTTRVLDLPRGTHELTWTPWRGGPHTVRVEARGPTGPKEVVREKVRVADPEGEGKKKSKGKKKGEGKKKREGKRED